MGFAKDTAIEYLGPSLERHKGCDLIDINPGVGVWSRKLHEAVQPRSHILMEQDAAVYGPHLQDLVDKPGVEFVRKKGVVWSDLTETLEQNLGHQPQVDPKDESRRNDTLLVSFNMAYWPMRPFLNFSCVSTMVLFQLIMSIRTSSLFQRYGQVRMLIWIEDSRKTKILPRGIIERKRGSFEADMTCEYIHEVVGADALPTPRTLRDDWINIESGVNVLARMRERGLVPPPGRETRMYKRLTGELSHLLDGSKFVAMESMQFNRPFFEELDALEAEWRADGCPPVLSKRLMYLRGRSNAADRDLAVYMKLLREWDDIQTAGPDHPLFAERNQAWGKAVESLQKNQYNEFGLVLDNHHLFRQPGGPLLFWDRRPFEPILAKPEDFLPNMPCTLLDLQPKPIHNVLRGDHPDPNVADVAELMLTNWFGRALLPVSRTMDNIWPGFGESYSQIKSLVDPKLGGSCMTGPGELRSRVVSSRQFEEVLEHFVASPFKPEYRQLVARLMDDSIVEDPHDDGSTTMEDSKDSENGQDS